MNIYEAMTARTYEKAYIRRKAWEYRMVVDQQKRALLLQPKYRILPTNTPEGCLVDSLTCTGLRASWSPTEDDLLADDWEPA